MASGSGSSGDMADIPSMKGGAEAPLLVCRTRGLAAAEGRRGHRRHVLQERRRIVRVLQVRDEVGGSAAGVPL